MRADFTAAALVLLSAWLWEPQRAAASASDQLEDAVEVEPGASCLRAQLLLEHIVSWLGTTHLPSPLSIQVHGSPHFARVVWFQILRDGALETERRFEPGPARCEDLHAALGLTIALAIKASLLDTMLGRVVVGPPPSVHEGIGWSLGGDLAFGYATIPAFAGGLGVYVVAAFNRTLAVRAGALGLFAPDAQLQRDDARMQAWLLAGRLDLCVALATWRGGQVAGCFGALVGQLSAHGSSFAAERTTHSPYFALMNAAQLSLELTSSWSVHLAAGVSVPVLRTRFVARDPSGTITDSRQLAPVGGFVTFGPSYRF